MYDSAKDAQDILQTSYEGTSKVKEARLEMLTSHFQNLKMSPNQTITELNSKVMKIENQAHALGEPTSNERLVKKVFHALSQKYSMKKTTIAEIQDPKV